MFSIGLTNDLTVITCDSLVISDVTSQVHELKPPSFYRNTRPRLMNNPHSGLIKYETKSTQKNSLGSAGQPYPSRNKFTIGPMTVQTIQRGSLKGLLQIAGPVIRKNRVPYTATSPPTSKVRMLKTMFSDSRSPQSNISAFKPPMRLSSCLSRCLLRSARS